ncbi:arylphorin subunit C223-like [Musca vetustissima]|uniref:arylphorin subunit C223-like n=1 Tax=Musca vetustissima TaxID=27455 RepID=UPI002AB63851|nr:arylphorin subunit C223-like [Musca vetustissima]
MAAVACVNGVKGNKDFWHKQKFLFEIVYRIEEPLMFEEYIKLGKTFTFDKTDYEFPSNYNGYLEKYYDAYKHGVTLPKGEFFGAVAYNQFEQMYGLFEFFYYAKTWETFQRNVCWARLHANEGMFVQALTLTVIHRDDFQGLVLPTIYEIFPHHFFNRKFVYNAEKFDFDVWRKNIMYEKKYKDIMYKDYAQYFQQYNNYNYFYTKDWKMWQWWKLMGLGEYWYAEERFMIRDNVDKNSKYLDMLKNVRMFWMPVDYSRAIDHNNQESDLSYFTEDLEWNSFWYYFNMDYAPFLDGEAFGLNKDRRGEYYVYVVRQILARYYVERLSHGYGEIPEFSFFEEIKTGYNPQLIHSNGVGYSYRKNYYELTTHGNFDYLHKVLDFFKRVEDIVTEGYYVTSDGDKISMRKPEAIELLGNMLQGNVDNYDKYFATFWYMFAHMYIGNVDATSDLIYPNIFLNYETMMRDPMFYMFYKKITNVFNRFHHFIEPYTHEELSLPGVTIENAEISDLITYFDLYDYDVTNLLNDKMNFVNDTFIWDTTLLARQMRLNHKDFDFNITINSQRNQNVVIRAYYGPKYNEFGKVIPLNENRENFIEIDEFYFELKPGVNTVQRSSKDFFWLTQDRKTYTELYKYIVAAMEDTNEVPKYFVEPPCGFPDRLVLPRGWKEGMPMQFFFLVYPFNGNDEATSYYDAAYYCGAGSGVRRIDNKPYGYPFDREINEHEFFAPNMFFKDVNIYHEDIFEKYSDQHDNKNYGKFDYSYYYKY